MSAEQQRKYRSTKKKNFEKRHMSRMPDITPGDMVLVGKGLDVKSSFIGPYIVLKTTKQQGRNSEDCVLPRLQ